MVRKSVLAVLLAGLLTVPVVAEEDDQQGPRPPQFKIVGISLRTKFIPEVRWQQTITSIADNPVFGELICPHSMAVDSRRRLLIADPCTRRVIAADLERKTYTYVRRSWRPFLAPVSVAVDSSDNVYVADAARAQIVVFNAAGDFLKSFGEGILSQPSAIVFDSVENRLYITDSGNDHLYKADTDGNFIWGSGGANGPEPFDRPTLITVGRYGMYVFNAGSGRVLMFDRNAIFRGGLWLPIPNPTGLAVDRDENLYVIEAHTRRVTMLYAKRPQPFTLVQLGTPDYLVPDPRFETSGSLFAADVLEPQSGALH